MEEKRSSEWQNREKVAAGRAWREILAEESMKLFNFKDLRRQNRLDAAEKFGLWLISTNLVWHLAEDMVISVLLKHAVFWEVCTPQNQECCSSVHCSLPVGHGYDYPWLPQGKRQSFCMASTRSAVKPSQKCPMFCPFPPSLCSNLRNWVYSWEVKCLPLSLACTWVSFDTCLVSAVPICPACWPPQHWWFSPLLAKPAAGTSVHPPVCGGCFSKGVWGLTLQNKSKRFFPSVRSRLTAEEQLSEPDLEHHLKTYTTFQDSGYTRSHKILRQSV